MRHPVNSFLCLFFRSCQTSTKKQSNTKEDIHEYEAVSITFPSSKMTLETVKLQNKMEEIDLVDCAAMEKYEFVK